MSLSTARMTIRTTLSGRICTTIYPFLLGRGGGEIPVCPLSVLIPAMQDKTNLSNLLSSPSNFSASLSFSSSVISSSEEGCFLTGPPVTGSMLYSIQTVLDYCRPITLPTVFCFLCIPRYLMFHYQKSSYLDQSQTLYHQLGDHELITSQRHYHSLYASQGD